MLKFRIFIAFCLLEMTLPSVAQPVTGKTFWTLFDSLGENNGWQTQLATLSGMKFYPTLNQGKLSCGGTTTEAAVTNGMLDRAKSLVSLKDKYPIDIVMMENVNDIGLCDSDKGPIGSMDDEPWMQGEKLTAHAGALESLASAKAYADSHLSDLLAAIPESQRNTGTMLVFPYRSKAAKGAKLQIKKLPVHEGNVYVSTGRCHRVGIHVTPKMSERQLINEMSRCWFGTGWKAVNNGDATLTLHTTWKEPEDRKIVIDVAETGIEISLTETDQSMEYIRYFMGHDASEWNDTTCWTDHVSLYSTYKGLFAYLKRELPQSQLHWILPSYYNFNFNDPALLNTDGTFNAAAYYKTDNYRRWTQLRLFQRKVCAAYGIPVIDVDFNCGIHLSNVRQYYHTQDCHPTSAGYHTWAAAIDAYFRNNCYVRTEGVTFPDMRPNSVQGMAAWNDYLVVYYSNGNKGAIFSLTTGKKLSDLTFDSGSFAVAHGNALCFGRERAHRRSMMPLLYVSQWDGEGGCLVYDIRKKNSDGTFEAVLVQSIMYERPDSVYGSRLGDWVVDSDDGYIWACKYHLDSSVEIEGNGNHFSRFRLPKLKDGRNITLRHSDISDHFTTKFLPIFQGKTWHDGKLYIAAGGDWIPDLAASQKVYEIDVRRHLISCEFDLSRYGGEPEGLTWSDGCLQYLYGGGDTLWKLQPVNVGH